jgi:glycogen operon protein
MITMGDELWRTQGGNNNAYCQDNEISWVDWSGSAESRNMLDFFRRTLAIRSEAPALRQGEFFDGRAPGGGDGIPDLVWFNPRGVPMTDEDWFDGSRRTLLMWVDGTDVRGHSTIGEPLTDVSWLLVVHADAAPATLTLPGPPYSRSYAPVLDTDSPTGAPRSPGPLPAGEPVVIPGRTVWLLRADRSAFDLSPDRSNS